MHVLRGVASRVFANQTVRTAGCFTVSFFGGQQVCRQLTGPILEPLNQDECWNELQALTKAAPSERRVKVLQKCERVKLQRHTLCFCLNAGSDMITIAAFVVLSRKFGLNRANIVAQPLRRCGLVAAGGYALHDAPGLVQKMMEEDTDIDAAQSEEDIEPVTSTSVFHGVEPEPALSWAIKNAPSNAGTDGSRRLVLESVQAETEECRRDGLSLALAGSVFKAPVFEEVMFRQLLFQTLAASIHPAIACAASAAAFGAAHTGASDEDVYIPVNETWSGMVYGGAYFLSGRIAVPIALHMANNLYVYMVNRVCSVMFTDGHISGYVHRDDVDKLQGFGLLIGAWAEVRAATSLKRNAVQSALGIRNVANDSLNDGFRSPLLVDSGTVVPGVHQILSECWECLDVQEANEGRNGERGDDGKLVALSLRTEERMDMLQMRNLLLHKHKDDWGQMKMEQYFRLLQPRDRKKLDFNISHELNEILTPSERSKATFNVNLKSSLDVVSELSTTKGSKLYVEPEYRWWCWPELQRLTGRTAQDQLSKEGFEQQLLQELATADPDGTARLFSYYMCGVLGHMKMRINRAEEPLVKATAETDCLAFLSKPLNEVWTDFAEAAECNANPERVLCSQPRGICRQIY